MKRNKKKTNIKREVKKGAISITEVMSKSSVGTQVHEIQDPSERLIAVIGAPFFNEPKYYPTDTMSQKREYEYDTSDFDEHAQLIVNTATEIAASNSPQDLLAIAHWAREEMKLRTTPQVLLAVAAECAETKEFVRRYAPRVIRRADELKQVFIASRSLYGHNRSLPNSLKRGLADSFKKFKERDFLKYEGQERPHFSDILKMIDRRVGYPLSKPLDQFLKTGEVTDEKALPTIAARKKLAKCETFDDKARKLAAKSGANWEVLLSQFGNNSEVWEHLIDSGDLGYMALMRNLRNILQSDVSDAHLHRVAKKLVGGATRGKQYPFRFLAARKAITNQLSSGGGKSLRYHPSGKEGIIVNGINGAIDAVIEAMNDIPGRTLIAVDNSASMNHKVSIKSEMSMNEAACVLAAMLMKKSAKGSVCGAFGDKWMPAQVRKDTSALDIAGVIAGLSVGHSTNAEDVIKSALQEKKKFDRIIILSDMQTYGGSTSNGNSGYGAWYGTHGKADTSQMIEQYREKINKDCKLHCMDLSGSGKSLTAQKDTNTQTIAGFSEKILDMVLAFEGLLEVPGVEEQVDDKQVFNIEYIRAKYY